MKPRTTQPSQFSLVAGKTLIVCESGSGLENPGEGIMTESIGGLGSVAKELLHQRGQLKAAMVVSVIFIYKAKHHCSEQRDHCLLV